MIIQNEANHLLNRIVHYADTRREHVFASESTRQPKYAHHIQKRKQFLKTTSAMQSYRN